MRMSKLHRKLLIVDDDPSILIALRSLFEINGYEVFVVSNGKECIDELKHGFEGVILLDLMMPLMDGWETLDEIVKQDLLKGNIISILTARDDPGDSYKKHQNIVRDYITKPFNPKELVATVNNYFKKDT